MIPIILLLLICLPIEIRLSHIRRTRIPLSRLALIRARSGYFRATMPVLFGAARLARGMARAKARVRGALPRLEWPKPSGTRAKVRENIAKALRYYGAGMGVLGRLRLRLARLDPFPGLMERFEALPSLKFSTTPPTKPSRSVLSGVIDGKHHHLEDERDEDGDAGITWSSKYARVRVLPDGTQKLRVKVPRMETTGKNDKDGKPIQKKTYDAYHLTLKPVEKATEFDFIDYRPKAELRKETKFRPKVKETKTETRSVVMPKGEVRAETVEVPIYETKLETGPDGVAREVAVQEEYEEPVLGDIPGTVTLGYSWGTASIEMGNTKTKETIILATPVKEIGWEIKTGTRFAKLELITNPEDPEFGTLQAYGPKEFPLGFHIPAPTAHDEEHHPVECHWAMPKRDELRLVIDTDLEAPWPRVKAPEPAKEEPILAPDGKPIERVKAEELPEYPVFPITIDPSVTWNGTTIEVSGPANTLSSIKTLYGEGFNNAADGTALDTYDPNWVVTKAGASVAEIDTAQYKTGNSGLRIYRDGANNVMANNDNLGDFYDNVRLISHIRPSINNGSFFVSMIGDAGLYLCNVNFDAASNIGIYYGDGAGGSNIVTAKAYAINTWYKVMIEIDTTNDKYRVWIDDVLYPGPNANAGGWDKFQNDRSTTYVDTIGFLANGGTGEYAVDDITIELGDEIYSYGYLPYSANEISEAVSPTGTLSGMDGDWANIYPGSVGVDNADVVIGTNSIKMSGNAGTDHCLAYDLDTEVEVSNYEGIEGYVKISNLTDATRYEVWINGNHNMGGTDLLYKTLTGITAAKWLHFRSPYGSFTDAGAWNGGAARILVYTSHTTNQAVNISLDDIHFYGARNGRGSAWSSQSIQTKSGTTTQLNRTVPMPAVNSPVNSKNSGLGCLLPLEANGTDSSGLGADFTAAGTPGTEGNPIYGGTHTRTNFDGVDDEYHASLPAGWRTSTGAISCWFETDIITAATFGAVWTAYTADNDRVILERAAEQLVLIDNVNAAVVTYYLADIVVDRAYHCVWIWDGAYWDFYLDGKRVLHVQNTKGLDDLGTGNVYIGCTYNAAATTYFFDGAIWDWAIYTSSGSVTPDQCTQLAGAGKDLYVDDTKGLTINASGTRFEQGRRYPEEPNGWCEATTDWAGGITSLSDAVYGTKSIRTTRTATGAWPIEFHSGADLNANLQKFACAQGGLARAGKIVWWMRASHLSETFTNSYIYSNGAGWNWVGLPTQTITLTTYWKKYEYNLSDYTVGSGTRYWSDIDKIYFAYNGGAVGSTIDINDLHFEERIVTDRSTTSGAYFDSSAGKVECHYSGLLNVENVGTIDIYHHCSVTPANETGYYWGARGNTSSVFDDVLITCSLAYGFISFINPTATFNRIQINGTGIILAQVSPQLTNSIFPDLNTSAYSAKAVSYNHNNVQGSHKLYGNVPFASTTVSDFPRSKTRLTNSSKGWTIDSGSGTVERTIDGSLFLTNDDGADTQIYAMSSSCCSIDIGATSDTNHPNNYKIKLKTLGCDASWVPSVYFSTVGIGTDYISYDLATQANDIDTTLTVDVSGSPTASSGSTDRTNINHIMVGFWGVGSGTVRVWVDELYLETDSGKVYFESSATVSAYKVTVGASTSLVLDKGITWTWDNTSGCGFDSSSTGSLLFLGTAGSGIVMTSAAAPPTNYWATYTAGLVITADYSTFRYCAAFNLIPAGCDVDNCTIQYAQAGNYGLNIEGSPTSCTNITLDNCAKGLQCSVAYASFSNIVLTNVAGVQVRAINVKLEFLNSNFSADNCDCGATGVIYSRVHNDVANAFVAVLADGDTQSFTAITNEPAATDNWTFYLEAGGTAATFNFDENSKTIGSVIGEANKTITVGITGTGIVWNGPTVTLYKATLGAGADLDVAAGITWKWYDLAGCGFDSASTGTIHLHGTTGSHITMTTNAVAAPTNYWGTYTPSGIIILADYTDFRYMVAFNMDLACDVDYCTFQYAESGNYSVAISVSPTSFTNNTISNGSHGLRSSVNCSGFDNIVISSMTTFDVRAYNAKIEFTVSNFDIAKCTCDDTGIVFSYNHNDVDGNFVVVLASGDTVAFSEMTTEPDFNDDLYLYLEAGGTAATFNFDENSKSLSNIYVETDKAITLGITGTGIDFNGPAVNVYKINSGAASDLDIAFDTVVKFYDLAGCGLAGTGSVKFNGSSGHRVTVRSNASGTPTNYWAGNGPSLRATYTDFAHSTNLGNSAAGTIHLASTTVATPKSDNYAVQITSGMTISSFSTVTITGAAYGLSCAKASAAFSAVSITATTNSVKADDVLLEFASSTFDETICDCSTSGVVSSKDHSGTSGTLVIILPNGGTGSYAAFTQEADPYDDIYLYVEKSGTAATMQFDDAGKEYGVLYRQAAKTFTIDWGTYTAPPTPRTVALDRSVDDQLTLTWTHPATTGGWARTAYKVYRGLTSGGETLHDTLASTALSHLDTGLPPRTYYYYYLKAVNSVGDGTACAEVSQMTNGPPNVPQTLAMPYYFDRSASLTWLTPADDGGHTITAYKVYRAITAAPTTLLDTLGVVLKYQDRTCSNNTTYYYRVTAINSYGESAASSDVSAHIDCNHKDGYARRFLSGSVLIELGNARNDYGESTYPTSYYAYCRTELAKERLRKTTGEVIVARTKVILDGSVTIDEEDKVTLSTGEKALVLKVLELKDGRGTIILKEALT